jgi:hypothetical protein
MECVPADPRPWTYLPEGANAPFRQFAGCGAVRAAGRACPPCRQSMTPRRASPCLRPPALGRLEKSVRRSAALPLQAAAGHGGLPVRMQAVLLLNA